MLLRVSARIRRGARLGAALLALLEGAPALASEPMDRLGWQSVPAGPQDESVAALALAPGDGGLAVGDSRGVRIVDASGGFRRLLQRGPVRDLAFLPDSLGPPATLLAATGVGFYRVERDGRARLLTPAPGVEARDVHRIAVSATAVAVATSAGAFLSDDVRRWTRLAARLPLAPARAVALRETAAGLECLAVVDERLWSVRLARGGEAAGAGLRAEQVTLQPIAGVRGESGGPVDVVFDVGGADAVALLPGAFAVRAAATAGWSLLRPVLPPGASARRLLAARGRLWLATDRGLLTAPELAGPWQRAAPPAGSGDVRALAGDAQRLYAAAGDRVLAARERAAASDAPAALRLRTAEGDPPIELVHRAALAYLDLRPERIARLSRGAARRGWLPVVALRLVRARDEDRGVDHDEAFTSGETRLLVDRDRSLARDFEASLSFSWDLGDLAYYPEQIDVSREAREVIKLRDDVLDEVTQLYFERRRVLAELAARPDAPPAEALRLRLRAAELAAGIDAWTGGWFQRARAGGP